MSEILEKDSLEKSPFISPSESDSSADDSHSSGPILLLRHEQKQQRRKLCLPVLGVLIASVVIFLTLIWSPLPSPSTTDSQQITRNPCGNTASEAKARGCHFDVLSFCWVPTECYDDELTSKFRAAGPWTFYTNMNKTAWVTEEQFGDDTDHIYLTNRLHKTHCAFNILRFHTAISEGRMVHREDVLTHTQHCTQVLVTDNEPDDIQVRAKIQYPDCGYFSTDFPGQKKKGSTIQHLDGHRDV